MLQYKDGDIDQIARTCHSVHNAHCKDNFQEVIAWEDKSEDHREMVKNSIKLILNGTVNSPEEAHRIFVSIKQSKGWVYGKEFNAEDKVNPRLCTFKDLKNRERQKDNLFFAVVNSFKK